MSDLTYICRNWMTVSYKTSKALMECKDCGYEKIVSSRTMDAMRCPICRGKLFIMVGYVRRINNGP